MRRAPVPAGHSGPKGSIKAEIRRVRGFPDMHGASFAGAEHHQTQMRRPPQDMFTANVGSWSLTPKPSAAESGQWIADVRNVASFPPRLAIRQTRKDPANTWPLRATGVPDMNEPRPTKSTGCGEWLNSQGRMTTLETQCDS
jgi:hypothetical protein